MFKMMISMLFASWLSANATAATLQANAHPVENSKGHLHWSLFNNGSAFEADGKPFKEGTITAVTGADQIIIPNLPAGTYAFTVFHDVNDNGKLDTTMFGQPEEMFGISNITTKLWSHPKWQDVKFDVTQDQTFILPILMKMQ